MNMLFSLTVVMSHKPSLPKGTRDFNALQVQRRKHILQTIELVFKKYGFMPIETPAMENLSTLEGKYGEEGDQLLFRILNSGDYLKELKDYNDRMLADESKDRTYLPSISGKLNDLDAKVSMKFIAEKGLRYDLTVPFARYVVMNRNEITFPFRRYQMQPVWRADRPQKGRYREFWQCDADVIGSNSLLNEIDLILIYAEVFTALAIPYEIKLNNRKVLAGIAEVVKGKEHMNSIALSIDKLDKVGEEGVRNELSKHGFTQNEIQLLFEIIQSKGEQLFDELKIKLKDSAEGLNGIEELEYIIHTLRALPNQPVNLSTDFSLARGLTYYTGAIFEVVATAGSLKSSIGGGGRYDNLTGIFGLPDVSGVGISFGLDRIYDVMEDLSLFPDSLQASTTRTIFCYFDKSGQAYAINAAAQLRQAGIATEVYPDVVKKIGKQLDYANALNIPFAVIIGENEIKSGKPVLKNLTAGTQQELSLTDIITHIQSHLA
jgi:histidyl-tRNA synthetase